MTRKIKFTPEVWVAGWRKTKTKRQSDLAKLPKDPKERASYWHLWHHCLLHHCLALFPIHWSSKRRRRREGIVAPTVRRHFVSLKGESTRRLVVRLSRGSYLNMPYDPPSQTQCPITTFIGTTTTLPFSCLLCNCCEGELLPSLYEGSGFKVNALHLTITVICWGGNGSKCLRNKRGMDSRNRVPSIYGGTFEPSLTMQAFICSINCINSIYSCK